MTIRIGVNGLGRIERMMFRAAAVNSENIEVIAINDLLEPDYLAYVLEYSSVHGHFDDEVSVDSSTLVISDEKIRLTAVKDPSELRWGKVGAGVVIESTDIFLIKEGVQKHIDTGAKKVIVSAPSKDDTPMFVYGVNHETYKGETIISNTSCTTNCLIPVAKVLNGRWDIKHSPMTTVHATTTTQKTVGGPSSKDWCGGRDILENIIPSSAGVAKAVGMVIPQLSRKLTDMSFRAPTSGVSVIDLTVELESAATYTEIYAKVEAQSEGALKGVFGHAEDKVVATDSYGDARTSIFDVGAGITLDGTFIGAVSWYDSEWGYPNKCLEMARVVGR